MKFYVFLFLWSLAHGLDEDNGGRNYEDLFNIGKDSYLGNDWANCVKYFNLALEDYRYYKDAVTNCKIKCRQEVSDFVPLRTRNLEDFHFFEKVTRNTLCLMKCKRTALGKDRVEMVEKTVAESFDNKGPYNYLQLCYYQLKRYQDAANAAFTNLVYNQEDDIMAENLKIYTGSDEVDKENIINLESPIFTGPFFIGTDHYRAEEWGDVVGTMEEAVDKYLRTEEECRFDCEKPFDQGWFPDFVSSVANHFTFCLRCKQQCVVDLQNVNGEEIVDIYPLMYHYLQFAYYNLGDLKKAASCVETYLLFFPEDKEMLANKKFYLNQDGVDPEWFKARKEALEYVERDDYEKDMIEFIEKKFDFEGGDKDTEEESEDDLEADQSSDNLSLPEEPSPIPPPVVRLNEL